MVRYIAFITVVAIGTASALAAIIPDHNGVTSKNVTVVVKNQDFPVYGPIVLEPCAEEDCSDANS